MGFVSTLAVYLFTFTAVLALAHAAKFEIRNQCTFPVWAAATPVGGGRRLERGQTWPLDVPAGTAGARIWGRTNCNFDANGRGKCQTGDCGGALECKLSGQPPATLAEFTLNKNTNQDAFDISVIDGFNIPMEFSPTRPNGDRCKQLTCKADINGPCPGPLKVQGGCNGPCTVFKTEQYCCNGSGPCNPTDYSRFFKDRCPDAYSYPKDDTATYTCPGGNDYRVVFCP